MCSVLQLMVNGEGVMTKDYRLQVLEREDQRVVLEEGTWRP